MTLTKQQRNAVYKRAKELYAQHSTIGGLPFLCDIMNIALEDMKLGGMYNSFPAKLPEFWAFKPRHLGDWDVWWPVDDREVRAKCIEECIKQTEE